jgi:SPP1 family predicted phage head-tail adaptor
MKIGDLDTPLILFNKTTSTDAFGQRVETFVKAGTMWAKRFDRNAGEITVGDRVVQVLRTEFTIRHNANVTEMSRIKHDGKMYRVDGVLVIGRKRWMKLICSRRDD